MRKNFRDQFLKILENNRMILIGLGVILVVVIGVLAFFLSKMPEKKVYEVAVMVRDQYSSNPEEDMRSSLKVGDVLVVKGEGLEWSQIEKVSYLILRMKLNEEQAQKLTQADGKEVKKPEPIEEELANLSPEQQQDLKKEREEPDFQTIRPRKYRINMNKFKDFDPITLLSTGQPYMDKVYDWGIVEEKQ